MSKDSGGLEYLLRHKLEQREHGEMIDGEIELYKIAGKEMLSHSKTKEKLQCQTENIRKRNAAGAIAKAQKFQPLKDKVSQIYKSLKATNQGKNPSFKTLSRAVEEIYSEDELSLNTLRDWHKKLNRGETL